MIKLSQQAIVDLFADKLRKLGCKKSVKVVGKSDPTMISVIKGEVGMEYGLIADANWPGKEAPDPQIVEVRLVELPYGTDVNFRASGSDSWQSAYLDGQDDSWHRVTGYNFFKNLTRLINESVSAKRIKAELVLADSDEGEFDYDGLSNHE